jgi:hypothetical protein
MPHQPGSSAQRIRYGFTGLAIAFLVILLGTIISKASHEGTNRAAQEAAANEPSEPLAEVGVAPGSSDQNTNNSATINR